MNHYHFKVAEQKGMKTRRTTLKLTSCGDSLRCFVISVKFVMYFPEFTARAQHKAHSPLSGTYGFSLCSPRVRCTPVTSLHLHGTKKVLSFPVPLRIFLFFPPWKRMFNFPITTLLTQLSVPRIEIFFRHYRFLIYWFWGYVSA